MAGIVSGKVLDSILVSAAALVLACAIPSCSGVPAGPEGAAKKMLRAYGGSENVERLRSFVGKGFIRDLGSPTVAKSYAFDLYRKGSLYKHKIMSAPKGRLTDVIVLYYDGTTSREWVNGRGTTTIPAMEHGILKYRFPDCILWAQSADRKGEMAPVTKGDNVVRVRYAEGTDIVTLMLDRKSWLVSGVEIATSTDSSASFIESYDHYTEVDGIPFPQEFKATFKGRPYYDYMLSKIELRADLPDSLFRLTAEDSAGVGGPTKDKTPSGPAR